MTSFNNPKTESPPQTRSRWLAGGLFFVALTSQFALGWLTAMGCSRFSDYSPVGLFIAVASGLAFSLVGGLILFYRPHNRVGWLCLWTGIGLPTLAVIDIYIFCGLTGHITAPGLTYLAWLLYSFGAFLVLPPMFILLPMLYPNGQFLSPRWRGLTIGAGSAKLMQPVLHHSQVGRCAERIVQHAEELLTHWQGGKVVAIDEAFITQY